MEKFVLYDYRAAYFYNYSFAEIIDGCLKISGEYSDRYLKTEVGNDPIEIHTYLFDKANTEQFISLIQESGQPLEGFLSKLFSQEFYSIFHDMRKLCAANDIEYEYTIARTSNSIRTD